jgi:uncharacterized membrane protein YccC
VKLPTFSEIEFSVKSFAAAMLALYLAMRIGIASPFWAMTTVYVVSSPQAGPMRSKAIYRIFGTFVGSAVTVFLVPRLVNSPELLSFAIALWVGVCLFVSLLDRTPRSYVFMLAGYTAALVGFTAVSQPQQIFDIALARVEEITLGIVCATLMHSLVLPRSFAPSLLARLDAALADARRWVHDALTGVSVEQAQRERRKLASDITELRLLATHLPFDTSHLRWTTSTLLALQDRLAFLVPVMSGVEDRLRVLGRRDDGSSQEHFTPQWRSVLKDVGEWVQAGATAAPERAVQLHAAIDGITPPIHRDASWSELLKVNLAARLRSVVDACDDSRKLRRHLSDGLRGAAPAAGYRGLSARALHHDYRLALQSAFAATLATALCCAFWIATGWPAGSGMPIMAAILCCLFATLDDPTPNIKNFLYAQVMAIPFAAIYLLLLIPAVHNFESLVLMTAPMFLALGVYIARPTTARHAMPMLFGVVGALGLQARDITAATTIPDIVSFINSVVPQLCGMFAAVLITRLVRTVSAGRTAHHVLRAGWKELAAMTSTDKVPSVAEMSARMLDRMAQLTPRLSAIGPEIDPSAVDAMRDLRVGLNMTQLVRFQAQLQRAVSLQALLTDLSAHFRRQTKQVGAAEPALLARIDATLRGICAADGFEGQRQAAAALVGIRRDLFPEAPPYQPVPESIS